MSSHVHILTSNSQIVFKTKELTLLFQDFWRGLYIHILYVSPLSRLKTRKIIQIMKNNNNLSVDIGTNPLFHPLSQYLSCPPSLPSYLASMTSVSPVCMVIFCTVFCLLSYSFRCSLVMMRASPGLNVTDRASGSWLVSASWHAWKHRAPSKSNHIYQPKSSKAPISISNNSSPINDLPLSQEAAVDNQGLRNALLTAVLYKLQVRPRAKCI